jgi:hypothetical protein
MLDLKKIADNADVIISGYTITKTYSSIQRKPL